MTQATSEIRDGMRIEWDVPIAMDDGIVLRADIFRPVNDDRHLSGCRSQCWPRRRKPEATQTGDADAVVVTPS